MGKLWEKVSLTLLLVVYGSLAPDSCAWGQAQAPVPGTEGRIYCKGCQGS
jgi:hypothetical protein